jgi:predicted nuclease with TOPRIM domain
LNSQELVEYQFKNQLQQSEAVNQNLTKQLEAKEVILKSKDEEMKRLTTDKDGLTKKVQSLNQRVSQLERQTRNAVSMLSLNDTRAARDRTNFS